MLECQMLAAAGVTMPANQSPVLPDGTEFDLSQLRHHTKNALERIRALVTAVPGLKSSVAGRRLADEVERRIILAAQASDALFGLTQAPPRLEERLRILGEALAELYADPDQVIQVEVACTGSCPAALHDVVLRVVQELVGNAAKHGFYARLMGCVCLELSSGARGTKLVVADDGWGLGHRPADGQGLGLVRALIAPFGGTLSLRAGPGVTAELWLPAAASGGRIATLVAQDGQTVASR